MFKRITLKNFRTHVESTLELGAVTLLIGGNNTGKTNFLTGIHHFSELIARGCPSPETQSGKKLCSNDFFPHRHRLAPSDSEMAFSSLWAHKRGEAEYSIELYENKELRECVGCREKIRISEGNGRSEKVICAGYETPTDKISLEHRLESENLTSEEKFLTNEFFKDLTDCFSYNFQPSFFKQNKNRESSSFVSDNLSIASRLGYEGGNLQEILNILWEKEPAVFERLIKYLRNFESSFQGIEYNMDKKEMRWLFDFWREPAMFDEFSSDAVSDGLLRAAIIALLSLTPDPPALMMTEEVENGMSHWNLVHYINLMKQAAGPKDWCDKGYKTQFVITSHSLSVLCHFSKHLDEVYCFSLDRRGYKSVVKDLNSALSAYVDMGTLEGEFYEKEGKRVVEIIPIDLTELWYSGVISG